MNITHTQNIDDIRKFYLIVITEYFRQFRDEFELEKLLSEYENFAKSRQIYVIKQENKVIGGFEINNSHVSNNYQIPCQKYVENLNQFLPDHICQTKKYVELSKMAISKPIRNKMISEDIISYAGDLCFYSYFDALILFAPKAHTILYRKIFKRKLYKKTLLFKRFHDVFKPSQRHPEFYLSIIYRHECS